MPHNPIIGCRKPCTAHSVDVNVDHRPGTFRVVHCTGVEQGNWQDHVFIACPVSLVCPLLQLPTSWVLRNFHTCLYGNPAGHVGIPVSPNPMQTSNLHKEGYVFASLLVCRFVRRIIKTLWITFHQISIKCESWDRKQSFGFWGVWGLDPGKVIFVFITGYILLWWGIPLKRKFCNGNHWYQQRKYTVWRALLVGAWCSLPLCNASCYEFMFTYLLVCVSSFSYDYRQFKLTILTIFVM